MHNKTHVGVMRGGGVRERGKSGGGGGRWEAEVGPSLNSVCQQTLFQQAREVQ